VISEYDKLVYNSYLKTSRSRNKLPYKFIKNFEKVDDRTFVQIKKLSSFLKRFPHIKIDEFFNAPYNLYPDETYFPIEYFTSLKATKAYTLFQKKKINEDPDSLDQLQNIKESLMFINSFCRQQNIDPLSYIHHKTNNEFSFLIHLKEHKVNVYTLLGFVNFEKNLKTRDAGVAKFIIGEDVYNNIQNYRTRLFNSHKAVRLVELGIKKISNSS